MFQKTRGILLKKTKLANGGLVLKFYTEEFGVKSFIGRSSKKVKNTFLPLSIASFSAYANPKNELNNIKDYETEYPLRDIYQDIYKSNILIFLNEILNHVIQEEEKNLQKFNFLIKTILELETQPLSMDFHLIFLMQFTSYLGLEPDTESKGTYFDFAEGEIKGSIPTHIHFFDESETVLFKHLYDLAFEEGISTQFTNQLRKRALQLIVTYYRYHTDMRELKSLTVLETVFG